MAILMPWVFEDFVFVCLVGFLTSSSTTRVYLGRALRERERLTILRAATYETERGHHDFCLSRSHYTDIDPTSRGLAATAGTNPGPPHQESCALPTELPRPRYLKKFFFKYREYCNQGLLVFLFSF